MLSLYPLRTLSSPLVYLIGVRQNKTTANSKNRDIFTLSHIFFLLELGLRDYNIYQFILKENHLFQPWKNTVPHISLTCPTWGPCHTITHKKSYKNISVGRSHIHAAHLCTFMCIMHISAVLCALMCIYFA